jgi:hypothetical protein
MKNIWKRREGDRELVVPSTGQPRRNVGQAFAEQFE